MNGQQPQAEERAGLESDAFVHRSPGDPENRIRARAGPCLATALPYYAATTTLIPRTAAHEGPVNPAVEIEEGYSEH